jgi:hypothetical protein
MMYAGCTSNDPAAQFVGSWHYAAGSIATVTCDGSASTVPFDTVVETFTESNGELTKTDSQGCAGLMFDVSGDVASLSSSGQSCTIPASGSTPSALFAPSIYSFTLDDSMLTEALTAAYTISGAPACTVTAANSLTKQ